MSLLSMIQGISLDLGLAKPTEVVSSTDRQVLQMLEIANREGRDLASRFLWSKMVLQNTFTIAASQDQGLMNSAVVSAGDFDYIIPDSFWNQTTSQPIIGPLSWRDWETREAIGITGPFPEFLLRSGKLFLSPTPTVGTQTGAFEYKSTSWCQSSGGTGRARWAADNDVGRLDEDLMSLGITWRWLKRKGLDYGEDFVTYEKRILDAFSRDGGRKTLNSGGRIRRGPGIGIPSGSWPL